MNKLLFSFSLLLFLLIGTSCKNSNKQQANQLNNMSKPSTSATSIQKTTFGSLPDGRLVDLYTLTNNNGLIVKITNYGGIITELQVPDKHGQLADVALGFDSLAGYLKEHPYFGAIIGRYGNRIANGQFTINNKTYKLATNNGPNHLHGGLVGFDKKLWQAAVGPPETAELTLTLESEDGEEGYPGRLNIEVIYSLNNQNELTIQYTAQVKDKATPINLTNHTYFNLSGNPAKKVLDHEIQLIADYLIPVDQTLIPTGELLPLDGEPFDFRKPKSIAPDIHKDHVQLQYGGGFDHCWVLRKQAEPTAITLAARAYEPTSGRVLEVLTTEPGIQFYTGNFLDGTLIGKGGIAYQKQAGFCLETQHYPDSPNQKEFPSTLLSPGETYETTTVFRFSTK